MNSNDIARPKRHLVDDDSDSSSNDAGHCGGPGGESSSHGSRAGKCPRVGHDNEVASRGYNNVGNFQAATNEGDEDLQENIRILRQQIQEQGEQLRQHQEDKRRFSFETLLAADEENFKVENETTSFSHVKGNHYGARTADVTNFNLSSPDGNIVRTMKRPSALVQEFRNNDGSQWIPRSYGSEAGICSIILSAVKDSIFLAEGAGIVKPNEVSHRLERSLFGCRPDIMVIRGEDGIGLVVIEVKQPPKGDGAKQLIHYESVVGHAYDQAQAMNAFGRGTSTVVISSFEESYLCSLEPDGLCSAEPSNQPFQDNLVETETSNQDANVDVAETKKSAMGCTGFRNSSSSRMPPAVSLDHTSDTGSTKSSPSASASGDSTGSTNETSSMSTFLAERSRKEDRTLYATTVHGPHELVRMLYTAIKIAKSKYKESTTPIFKLNANKSYEFPKALRVVNGEKKNYCWGKLQATLRSGIVSKKHQSTQIPIDSNNADSYYIIGILGHGSTSNVFQALTSDGEHVAIKVYVKNYNDHGEILDETSFQMVANEAVEREKERLLSFYPELFKDKVKTAKLFGRPCIIMPFIHSLTKSEREHHSTWTSMKKVLRETFFRHSVQYNKDDERWGHVGIYTSENKEKHLIFYDLADLENLETDDADNFVENSMDNFKARIGIDREEKCPVYVKGG